VSAEEPAGPSAGSSTLRRVLRTRDAWITGVRRAAWALVLGVILLLAALPTIDDLHSLLVTLGYALLALGALIVLATVYLRDS
jgi:hypothetical protein